MFALLIGGSDLVTVGDGVECKVRGILQVVDENEGPRTKREYEPTMVPVGKGLCGQVVDFLGRPMQSLGGIHGSPASAPNPPLGLDAQLPLLNPQPDMESREQIAEALVTGVKALDVLTPLGRGQALQVSGPQGSGKTQLCIDAVLGQRGVGVRCVYAAVGCSVDQLTRTVAQLQAHQAMGYTTVVAATADRPLGEQYAAMLTACSIAEAVRDAGGHALVVLNDVGVAVRMWEMITVAMADLGSVALEADVEEVMEVSQSKEEENGDMVEYEGMLISVAAAQRRRFFSSFIQRCAKMHRRLRGGSMTALLVVPGVPATGSKKKAIKEKMLQYRHLSEEQKAKLLHALEAQSVKTVENSSATPEAQSDSVPQELRTEVVEEFMSIVDGQIVLKAGRDPATGGVAVDPQLSVSRIGSRAFSPAVMDLAPQVRFELAQAEDARKFAADPAARKALRRAETIAAAMPQRQRTFCPLEVQVIHLLALRNGMLESVPLSEVVTELDRMTADVQTRCAPALTEIAVTRRLTATSEAAIESALKESREASRWFASEPAS